MQEAISFTPQLAASPIAQVAVADSGRADCGFGRDRAAEAAEAQDSLRRWRSGRLSFSLLLSLVAFGHVLADGRMALPCARR